MNKKELNLKWVSDVISETEGYTYKDWKEGSIVSIDAQTGTGKTYAILNKILEDKVEDYEELVYICNRVELRRAIQKDLLEKYKMEAKYFIGEKEYFDKNWIGNKSAIIDYEWLDNQQTIYNVTIMSYHEIANARNWKIYMGGNFNILEKYQYIVCDECQFFLTDASFNQKTYMAFDEIFHARDIKSRLIMLSATIEEVESLIEEYTNMLILHGELFGVDNLVHKYQYSTGRDYSYVNVKYFKDVDDMATLIKNSDEKWLVFVTSDKNGQELKNNLCESGVSSEFIKANEDNPEKKNLTMFSKFSCQCLIATKCIDNGVNIKDTNVKNIVVMAYDKTTFIQELGRLRLNIKDAHEINLYIRCCYKKTFSTMLKKCEDKQELIDLYNEDINKFEVRFNNDYKNKKLPEDIFYLNKKKEWTINKLGVARMELDRKHYQKMVDMMELDEFAFIKEQLSWLGLEDTFLEVNLIEDVVEDTTKNDLLLFLKDSYESNTYYTKEFFIETIEAIIESDNKLMVLFNKICGNGNRSKGAKSYNKLFTDENVNLPYTVGSEKKTIDGKRKNYWKVLYTEN
ncbi:MAG: DEAD/DEAH box helicase [Clostridium celatum]|nr:DEAD/DEAH box helicase [Clostridium celatum]MDU4979840.1 DEAD/DEAH box helicase [Clostridium celatum]